MWEIILGFHSHNQQPRFSTKTIEDVSIILLSISGGLDRDNNMAAISLFGDTNMAAVTSCQIQE